ncbi:gliding motility-associated ABC transporter substrate-binding protein GldG [Sungkyunkwania multivorans]|uniref:Gliding motility-associated ABC transporter substrate-binding protein GldG n=1 Tax=Sungkyunkwania multivorans TaxID=1173618 RepID=A0ABW3D064_9FLAO
MLAIIKREISTFFASSIGYLVIAIFLVLNGLFLWVFESNFNILDYGFADLMVFFSLTPWVLIFLIPAVCMRSFSDEKKQGTLELLLTKPLSLWQIVLGKYFGAVLLILLALIPTFLYVYTIWQLGNPAGNLDIGSVLGSYFGLLFLIASYTAIGIFASTLSENQIVALIIAIFLSFLCYYGFEGIADFGFLKDNSLLIENLGMKAHFDSMGRGVIDTRDVLYFLVVSLLFLLLTKLRLESKSILKPIGIFIAAATVTILVGNQLYQRFDLTQDQRYTLSKAAKNTVANADEAIIVDVLLGGSLPAEFKRLQVETRQMLEEFASENDNIIFDFVDPLEGEENPNRIVNDLQRLGLTPAQATISENNKVSQEIVFPWAIANMGERSVRIPLLKNELGATSEQRVSNSIQQLEYAFADGFAKLTNTDRKKVAILKGHGELDDRFIADYASTLNEYYDLAPFDMKALSDDHPKTLENLKRFDLFISAKPLQSFSEEEVYILDQYMMNGGKAMWLVDMVNIEMDSLYNPTGKGVAFLRDLNLGNMFFKYGARVNPELVKDLYNAPIVLAAGEGNNAQFNPLPWPYHPLTVVKNTHPIVNNTGTVKFTFANTIDTVMAATKKTILLSSSPLSKTLGIPSQISLEEATKSLEPQSFNEQNLPLAVLLEGTFTSAYKNRVKPLKISDDKQESSDTKMILIADGDVIKNQLDRNGRPLQLGFDKWTGNTYGNKEFLLNCANYLLDDTGLINIRSKEIAIAFLDKEKVADERNYWQAFNIGLPLFILGLFGVVFNWIRKRRYTR